MKKKYILFFSFLVMLGAVGISLLIVNHLIDQKIILSRLYDSVERQTGRTLTLNHVEFHLVPWPYVEASGISVSNTPNAKETSFIAANQLKATISLISLLKKDVYFDSLYLKGVQVHFEIDEKGKGNWLLSSSKKWNPMPRENRGEKNKKKWQMRLATIQLTDVNATFEDWRKNKKVQVHFNKANINLTDESKTHFEIEGEGHQAAYEITGKLNWQNQHAIAEWPSGKIPTKFKINLREYVQNQNVASMHLNGYVKDFFKFNNYDMSIRGILLNLNEVNLLFPHVKLPSMQNVAFITVLNDTYRDKDEKAKPLFQNLQFHSGPIAYSSGYRVENIDISSNALHDQLNVNANGSVGDQPFYTNLQFDSFEKLQQLFWLNEPVFSSVTGKIGFGKILTDVKGVLSNNKITSVIDSQLNNFVYFLHPLGSVKADHAEFKGEFSLDFLSYKKLLTYSKAQLLQGVNLNGAVKSSSIIINTTHFDQLIAPIDLKNGILSLKQLSLTNAYDKINISAVYPVSQSNSPILIQIHQSLIPMKWIEDYLKLPPVYSGQVELSGKITSDKNNFNRANPAISGQLALVGLQGKLDLSGVKHFMGKTSQTLPLGVGLDAKCLAALTSFDGKSIKFEDFTLDSKQFTLTGKGEVNMDNKSLTFHFVPKVYLGLFDASAPINLTGTLINPVAKFEKNKNKVFSLIINNMQKSNANRPDYCSNALSREKALGQ